MTFKKISIILILIFFLVGIYIFFFKNKNKQNMENVSEQKNSNLPNPNSPSNSEVEKKQVSENVEKIKENKPSKEEAMQYLTRFSPKNKSNYKTVYTNVEDFVKVLKTNSHMRLSSSSSYYFVDNIVAIPKTVKQKNKEILWEDTSNLYYKSSTTYQHYDQNKYIVMLDKETGRYALTSGIYIVKYKNNFENKHDFENKNRVKILSDYTNDKIVMLRAEQHSNLLEIFKKLKSEKNFEKVDLEITTSDVKAN